MTTEELEQIRKIIREETVSTNDLRQEITASENRVKSDLKQELKASEERLTQKIDDSQEDTINVLRELIHTGYEMHEERIAALEKHTEIHNPNKN